MRFQASSVRRLLLVKLRALGDAVLTLPSLQALSQGFPQAKISVLCPPLAAEVYNEDPRVHEVIPYEKGWYQALEHHARLFQGLQERRFDLAVCLHASLRTALLGWMSGAPWRSIRNHSGPDYFCNLKAGEPKESKSIIQRDFDALRALGLSPRDERPRLALADWAKREAAGVWRALELGKRAALCFPGAGKREKRWPLERWKGLGRALKSAGWTPLFLSAPGEQPLDELAKAAGGRAASVASLQVLGALARRAGRALGCDSGPRHLAAAAGAKTLTLFGPETLREWHPYRRSEGHWAVQAEGGSIAGLDEGLAIREARAWLRS